MFYSVLAGANAFFFVEALLRHDSFGAVLAALTAVACFISAQIVGRN